LNIRAAAATRLNAWLYVLPFATMLVLVLVCGLFQRNTTRLAALTLAFVALAIGLRLLLPKASPPIMAHVFWDTANQSESSSLTLTEVFIATAPLFKHNLSNTADQAAALLFPVFATPRDFFRQDARLILDLPEQHASYRLVRLEANLPPRTRFVYTTRSAALLPPRPQPTIRLAEGYIWQNENKTLLTQWAKEHPEIAPSLLTAFNLERIPINRNYTLRLPPDSPLTFVEMPERHASMPAK
ncbi:MAG: hypothetical protein FWD53_08570, partial [Phycisphaerales bacterium]|nr:hypothetical protein [Phycisphaerales bacterium]